MVAASNRSAAGKRAGWPLSPCQKSSFDSFVGFVTRKMKILLLVIGKTDEDYLITGIKKYVGRIGHYASFEMKEIPDPRNRKTLSEEQQKKAESFLLLQQLQPGDQVILLDENGK